MFGGKIALVTGAASGIGRAACRALAREGATIIAADSNSEGVAQTVKLLDNIAHHNGLAMDVADAQSVRDGLLKSLEHHNTPPSIIVNCAGITRDNFLLNLSEADFDEVINVNLKGTFLVTQTFIGELIKSGAKEGAVVNVASIIGKYGNIGQANYSASKAGVEMLTKTTAKELARHGIRCNAVLPGFIDTPMTKIVPEKVKEKFLSLIPCARLGTPEEVAEVIVFLASEKSSYVNGASIDVTGGF